MKLVRYESKDHIATITMDRASKHNAFNNPLCEELRQAWIKFRDSDDRVAVLASSEDDYFSVGADVKDFPTHMWHAFPGYGVDLDKPVIAATSGWVVGGAFVIVQMADLCVASETTRFLYPEAKLGITAGAVSSLAARMPHKVAMEFLLVADELSAERAYQVGFVNALVPKGQHVVRAQEMATKIAGNAPVAEVNRMLDQVYDSADFEEGKLAFRERRKPRFEGK